MAGHEIEGMLPNTAITACRDDRDISWHFVQTTSGIARQKIKVDGNDRGLATFDAPEIRSGSALAATKGGRTHPARLYYQDTSGFMREMLENNEKWTASSTKLPKMLPGSALAAVSWVGLDHLRVYYQDEQGILREHCYDKGKGWFAGKKLSDPMPRVPIAAGAVENIAIQIHDVFSTRIAINFGGRILTRDYQTKDGDWKAEFDTVSTNAAEDSQIGLTEDDAIYFQGKDNKLRIVSLENRSDWVEKKTWVSIPPATSLFAGYLFTTLGIPKSGVSWVHEGVIVTMAEDKL